MALCSLTNLYLIEFIHKVGNGWAFVGAPTPAEALKLFYGQTQFKNARVLHFKIMPVSSGEMGLVYEGGIVYFQDNNDRQIYDDFVALTHYAGTYNQWLKMIALKNDLVIDDLLSHDSENPVQNKVITYALDDKEDLLDYMTDRDVSALWGDVFN